MQQEEGPQGASDSESLDMMGGFVDGPVAVFRWVLVATSFVVAGCAGTPNVDADEVVVKREVSPLAPDDPSPARNVTCQVVVTIDASGVPSSVDAEQCPSAYRTQAERTVALWRWYPYRIDGEPTSVRFRMTVDF